MRVFCLFGLLVTAYYLSAQQLQYNTDTNYIWGCGNVTITAKLDSVTLLTISHSFDKQKFPPSLKIPRSMRWYAEIERHTQSDFSIPYKCTDLEVRNNFDFVKYYYKKGLVQIRRSKMKGQNYFKVRLRHAVFLSDKEERYAVRKYANKINFALITKVSGRF